MLDDPAAIRLQVPAHPDFVAVLRVATRAVAGRAGCDDDARSRFQAAAGRAFFAAIHAADGDATVGLALLVEPDRVLAELTAPESGDASLASLSDLADGHELVDDRHLRFWAAR